MDDRSFIRELERIADVETMLAAIVDHEWLLGYDPYYADLRQALLKNAERVLGREEG